MWLPARGVAAIEIPHEFLETDDWRGNAFSHMLATRTWRLRRRLAGPEARVDFPVLAELRDAGITDWLALVYGLGITPKKRDDEYLGVVTSWGTDRPSGWTAEELELVEELSRGGRPPVATVWGAQRDSGSD